MNKKPKTIEIEYRSIFDKKEYTRLKRFLDRNAENLGRDDKDVYFFIFIDKLFKVTNNISKKTAKISLKLNRVGKGSSFEEIEFPIKPNDVETAAEMFTKMDVARQLIHSFQKRNNYIYKGVELALKFSENWQYHMELELVIDHDSKKPEAEKKIRNVARELGVRLLTEEDLAEIVEKIESKYPKLTKSS